VIAWLLLIGAAALPFSIALHYPVMLFSLLITGWTAMAVYALYGAAHLYAGIGLLRLSEAARKFTIVYLVFSFFNGIVSWSVPGAFARYMQALLPHFGDTQPSHLAVPLWVVAIPTAIVYGIVITILIRQRPAFEQQGEAPAQVL
jgi:hypothetical protein